MGLGQARARRPATIPASEAVNFESSKPPNTRQAGESHLTMGKIPKKNTYIEAQRVRRQRVIEQFGELHPSMPRRGSLRDSSYLPSVSSVAILLQNDGSVVKVRGGGGLADDQVGVEPNVALFGHEALDQVEQGQARAAGQLGNGQVNGG